MTGELLSRESSYHDDPEAGEDEGTMEIIVSSNDPTHMDYTCPVSPSGSAPYNITRAKKFKPDPGRT